MCGLPVRQGLLGFSEPADCHRGTYGLCAAKCSQECGQQFPGEFPNLFLRFFAHNLEV